MKESGDNTYGHRWHLGGTCGAVALSRRNIEKSNLSFCTLIN